MCPAQQADPHGRPQGSPSPVFFLVWLGQALAGDWRMSGACVGVLRSSSKSHSFCADYVQSRAFSPRDWRRQRLPQLLATPSSFTGPQGYLPNPVHTLKTHSL